MTNRLISIPGKILLAAIIGIIAALSVIFTARAESPLPDAKPWMAAAAMYTGLGSVPAVQVAFKEYQDEQARIHNYDTPEKWHSNYPDDVTNFLRQYGCASCKLTDSDQSYKLKIDVPNFARGLRRYDLLQ